MGNVEVAYCRFGKSCHRTVFPSSPFLLFHGKFDKMLSERYLFDKKL